MLPILGPILVPKCPINPKNEGYTHLHYPFLSICMIETYCIVAKIEEKMSLYAFDDNSVSTGLIWKIQNSADSAQYFP